MAVVFLLKVIFVLLCLPMRVGYNENVQRIREPLRVLISFDIQYSELVVAAIIITCIMFVLYQLCSMRNQNKELQSFSESITSIQSKVNVVTSFYQETEAKFDELETKSKAIKLRFSKLQKNEQEPTSYGRILEEITYCKRSWENEMRAFGDFGIEECKAITQKDIQAQLTMAKAYTERELKRVESHAREDKLSLEEVQCDVRRLQKYFGRC